MQDKVPIFFEKGEKGEKGGEKDGRGGRAKDGETGKIRAGGKLLKTFFAIIIGV